MDANTIICEILALLIFGGFYIFAIIRFFCTCKDFNKNCQSIKENISEIEIRLSELKKKIK